MPGIAARKSTDSSTPTTLRLAPGVSKRAKAPIIGGALILLVATGLFGMATLQAGEREAVLAVARPVAAGHVLTSEDIKVVRVASDGNISPVAASNRSTVIGRPAAVGLVPDTLLTTGALGESTALSPSEATTGLALKPGAFPPGLSTGATVRVIATDAAPGLTLVERATVTSVGDASESSTGTVAVGIKIPASAANAVATASAAEHITLVEVAAP